MLKNPLILARSGILSGSDPPPLLLAFVEGDIGWIVGLIWFWVTGDKGLIGNVGVGVGILEFGVPKPRSKSAWYSCGVCSPKVYNKKYEYFMICS